MVVLCCIVVVTGFLPSSISRSSLSSPPSQVYIYIYICLGSYLSLMLLVETSTLPVVPREESQSLRDHPRRKRRVVQQHCCRSCQVMTVSSLSVFFLRSLGRDRNMVTPQTHIFGGISPDTRILTK